MTKCHDSNFSNICGASRGSSASAELLVPEGCAIQLRVMSLEPDWLWQAGGRPSVELSVPGASIPMGQGDMSPNIYEGGTSMVMSPRYFRSDVV